MSSPINVLFVEDSGQDVELIQRQLEKEGFSIAASRADTPEEFLRKITERAPDLILSDFAMPRFDGLRALSIAKQVQPNVPFILVTGSLNEETAVECMKAGAEDYVLKDHLGRLGPATRGALEKARMRAEKERAEEDLLRGKRELQDYLDNMSTMNAKIALDGTFLMANRAAAVALGLPKDGLRRVNFLEGRWWSFDLKVRERVKAAFRKAASGQGVQYDEKIWIHDGVAVINFSLIPIRDASGRIEYLLAECHDITAQKRAEEEVRLLLEMILSIGPARGTKAALDAALRLICEAMGWSMAQAWVWDEDRRKMVFSEAGYYRDRDLRAFRKASRDLDFAPGEGLIGRVYRDKKSIWIEDITRERSYRRVEAAEQSRLKTCLMVPLPAGDRILAVMEFYFHEAMETDLRLVQVVSALASHLGGVLERKRAVELLERKERQLVAAQAMAHMGHWEIDLKTRRVSCSEELLRIFEIRPEDFDGRCETFYERIHPRDAGEVEDRINRVFREPQALVLEYTVLLPDGREKAISSRGDLVLDGDGKPLRVVGIAQDVTERRMAEEEVRQSREKLRDLADHLQTIREEERTEVSREIHDELGQALTVLKLDLSLVEEKFRQGSVDKVFDLTRSMSQLIDETIQIVRRIASSLRPGLLDDLGLEAALEWQCQEFRDRSGLAFHLDLPSRPLALDSKRATTVFRIFQEILTNVARHARASRVEISLKEAPGEVLLEVRDDGVGITPEQYSNPKALGIVGMTERALMLDGELTFFGKPNQGTTVQLRVPLPSSEGRKEESRV